jgi:hypothetical protein
MAMGYLRIEENCILDDLIGKPKRDAVPVRRGR